MLSSNHDGHIVNEAKQETNEMK